MRIQYTFRLNCYNIYVYVEKWLVCVTNKKEKACGVVDETNFQMVVRGPSVRKWRNIFNFWKCDQQLRHVIKA